VGEGREYPEEKPLPRTKHWVEKRRKVGGEVGVKKKGVRRKVRSNVAR